MSIVAVLLLLMEVSAVAGTGRSSFNGHYGRLNLRYGHHGVNIGPSKRLLPGTITREEIDYFSELTFGPP
jgi:hypothetical protein